MLQILQILSSGAMKGLQLSILQGYHGNQGLKLVGTNVHQNKHLL